MLERHVSHSLRRNAASVQRHFATHGIFQEIVLVLSKEHAKLVDLSGDSIDFGGMRTVPCVYVYIYIYIYIYIHMVYVYIMMYECLQNIHT